MSLVTVNDERRNVTINKVVELMAKKTVRTKKKDYIKPEVDKKENLKEITLLSFSPPIR